MNALTATPAIVGEPGPTYSMRSIIRVGCQFWGISHDEMISQSRAAALIDARHATIWAIRKLTPRSYPEIALAIGNRDHTTILFAFARMEERLASDPVLAARVGLFMEVARRNAMAAPEVDPYAVAARIWAQPAYACNVSIDTIRAFAAIVLAARDHALGESDTSADLMEENARLRNELAAEKDRAARLLYATPPRPADPPVEHPLDRPLREFITAAAEVDRASGPYERTARTRLDKAGLALVQAGESHFNIKRKFK